MQAVFRKKVLFLQKRKKNRIKVQDTYMEQKLKRYD